MFSVKYLIHIKYLESPKMQIKTKLNKDLKKDAKNTILIEIKSTQEQKKNLKKLSTHMNCLKTHKEGEFTILQEKTIHKVCQVNMEVSQEDLEVSQEEVSIFKIFLEALEDSEVLEEEDSDNQKAVKNKEVEKYTHSVLEEEGNKE